MVEEQSNSSHWGRRHTRNGKNNDLLVSPELGSIVVLGHATGLEALGLFGPWDVTSNPHQRISIVLEAIELRNRH